MSNEEPPDRSIDGQAALGIVIVLALACLALEAIHLAYDLITGAATISIPSM